MAVCSGGKRLLGGQDGLGWVVSNPGLSLRALLSEKKKKRRRKKQNWTCNGPHRPFLLMMDQ